MSENPLRAGPAPGGLSLLEMLVCLAVASLLLGTGAPALRFLFLEARMSGSVNDLVHGLHFARIAAETRGADLVLCPGVSPTGCDRSGDWNRGWQVRPAGTGPERTAGNALLLRHAAPGVQIRSNRRQFVFRPFNRRDTNGTIGFCDERGYDALRAVVVSTSGRPRLASRSEARKRVKCGS